MNYLLDTHALVWWMADPARLSPAVFERIRSGDDRLFVSAGSVYEIAYKRERDQLLYRLPRDLSAIIPTLGFEWLSINPDDALSAAQLDNRHRDPWDRIIAAQAGRRRLDLITSDRQLTNACIGWAVRTFW
ncbi:MAG TPA: type II toxin-antitoxin system VapC family toxin [Caulobacter sp.]|nr:type II toxin-antitoxin system VapC family toxin [Caulobacter sp.]